MDAEKALSLLGKYNRWQLENYFLVTFGSCVPFVWNLMSIIFVGDTPNYRCALPPNSTMNESIPWRLTKDGHLEYDKCSMYLNLSIDNTTVPCQYGYWYDPESGYESTLTTEWDLVCGKEWLVELSMSVRALGAVVGALVYNKLADKYGRKKVFLGCLWSVVLTTIVLAFSPHIAFFAIVAFVNGMHEQGMVGSSYIMSVELFPTKERTFPGNVVEYVWAVGYMTLALIAYFVRNWRHLLLVLSVPLLSTVSLYWLLSESVPWLLSNGRRRGAEEILRKAAKRNNISLPDNIFDVKVDACLSSGLADAKEDRRICPDCHEGEPAVSLSPCNHTDTWLKTDCTPLSRDYGKANRQCMVVNELTEVREGFCDLMRSKTIRRYSAVFFAAWFVNGLTYTALNNTVTYLPGDRYLNTFLYAVMEIPAYTLTWILSHKVGRRLPLIICHVVGGVALMSTAVQTLSSSVYIKWIVVVLSMIGKLAITATFALIYIITPELYPTNIRNLTLGVCQMFARSGQLISPHARILYRYIPWLSPVLVGTLCTVVGLMSYVVPETRHTKLPDTIKEIEDWKTTDNPL